MASPEQQRVAAIQGFREELASLEAAGILSLDPAAKDRLRAHHDAELAALAARGDVDLTTASARLSLGMRLATLLGTIALSAAYALFVGARWGALPAAAQFLLVALPPLALVGLTHVAATRERSGYIASLLATVAVIAFHTNLGAVGWLYNLPDTGLVFLVAGGFALLLAYGYGLTLPLLPGIAGVCTWCWSLGAVPLGLSWKYGISMVEPLLLTALVAMTVPAWVRGPAKFTPWWRGIGAALLAIGLLFAGEFGNLSGFTSVPLRTIELGYQVAGAVALVGLVAWGLRRDQRIVTQIGAVGLVLYLYLRLVDWFWDLVPQWAFFLMVGALALVVLVVLRRLRRHTAGAV